MMSTMYHPIANSCVICTKSIFHQGDYSCYGHSKLNKYFKNTCTSLSSLVFSVPQFLARSPFSSLNFYPFFKAFFSSRMTLFRFFDFCFLSIYFFAQEHFLSVYDKILGFTHFSSTFFFLWVILKLA